MARKNYTNPVGEIRGIGDPCVAQRSILPLCHECGRRVLVLESVDLVNWAPRGYAYRRHDDSWGKRTYWAPEVIYARGMFYMVFSCQGTDSGRFSARICVAGSDEPGGPFKDLYLPYFDYGYSCIDGHIFLDDNGTPYLYYARVGVFDETWKEASEGFLGGMVFGIELSADLSSPIGEPTCCVKLSQAWEAGPNARARCNEGAFVIKHNGLYYMTYSANHYADPRYGIGYATAPHPLGPWTKSEDNPIVQADLSIGVSGPGHNCIVASPDGDELFMVYHSHANPANPSGNRVVNIDQLVFDDAGNMKLIGPSRTPQPAPSGT